MTEQGRDLVADARDAIKGALGATEAFLYDYHRTMHGRTLLDHSAVLELTKQYIAASAAEVMARAAFSDANRRVVGARMQTLYSESDHLGMKAAEMHRAWGPMMARGLVGLAAGHPQTFSTIVLSVPARRVDTSVSFPEPAME